MSSEFELFYQGQKKGVFSIQDIQNMLNEGNIGMDAMVKQNGVWVTLEKSSILQSFTDNSSTLADFSNASEEDTQETEETVIVCPHCWNKFNISEAKFIAKHIDLLGDPILGPDAQQRFLPSMFNAQGFAIDAHGMVCQDMACPRCHLRIPEALTSMQSTLFSIVGAPASGKSYFLTSMIWQLRNTLSRIFEYSFSDTDATFNSVLNNYESILFLNGKKDEYVALPKTELHGNDYSHQIALNGLNIDLPLPFIFTLTPSIGHPNYSEHNNSSRNLILYDNAGEHFEPGRDQVTSLATQHLIHSDGILFLYDPLKDSRMVKDCDSRDPQVEQIARCTNQLVLLNEMIGRIKKYSGIHSFEKYDKPLVVVIPKYDAWKDVFPLDLKETPFFYENTDNFKSYLDIGQITNVSFILREKLMEVAPEIVSTCENFFSYVYFIPVSSLGQMPEYDEVKDMIGIKPQNLQPIWAEVPVLLLLWYAGLLDAVASEATDYVTIEHYKLVGDSLTFFLPGSNRRETVPQNYLGYTVYSKKLAKFIKLPEANEANSQETNAQTNDNFWKQ